MGEGTRRADLVALNNGRAAGRFALDMLSWQTTDESTPNESPAGDRIWPPLLEYGQRGADITARSLRISYSP